MLQGILSFNAAIEENIYEYWKDGEMLVSSQGGTDEALTFFWKIRTLDIIIKFDIVLKWDGY